jgi:hypothetical protein
MCDITTCAQMDHRPTDKVPDTLFGAASQACNTTNPRSKPRFLKPDQNDRVLRIWPKGVLGASYTTLYSLHNSAILRLHGSRYGSPHIVLASTVSIKHLISSDV